MGQRRDGGEEEDESVSLPIMLLFSAANLILDILNMTCFARANMNFGLDIVRREQFTINEDLHGSSRLNQSHQLGEPDTVAGSQRMLEVASETTALVETTELTEAGRVHRRRISSSDLYHPEKPHEIVNLNMCSAWTVRHAPRSTFPCLKTLY
jgi:hypothetical protein